MIKALLEKINKNNAIAMILCCGIPMVGILVLSSLGILGSWGFYALFLLCPLAHLLMMGKMHPTPQKIIKPSNLSKGRTDK